MVVQDIYLEDWNWSVKVFYAVDTYYVDEILGELESIGCTEHELLKAEKVLSAGDYNVGLTYSNLPIRCSVIVIGLTSSPAEFQNTFDHEKGHLAMHICHELDIDPFSEEFQYLVGEIGMLMFPIAEHFLCKHCRKKFIKSFKGEE